MRWIAALSLPPLLLLAACGKPQPTETIATAGNEVVDNAAFDFTGRWKGPEGLYFQVTAGSDDEHFKILNRWTLDDEASFVATREGRTLTFVREGVNETARLGNGADTGFKWLTEKKDCLIIKAGAEGYCRD
jgi:hypothetical protein